MGLFSSSKKTFVSSTVYNLAGPEEDRANYLKTLVMSNVIDERDTSMGQTITNGYLNGPGIKIRSFARWSRNQGYSDLVGIKKGTLQAQASISPSVIAEEIPHNVNQQVNVQSLSVGEADFTYWVDQWVLENEPSYIEDNYVADLNLDTYEVTITFSDDSVSTFLLTNYDTRKRYIYAAYRLINVIENGDIEVGEQEVVSSFPNMSDWVLIDTQANSISVELDTIITTTVSYSDGRPDEVTVNESSNNQNFTEETKEYSLTEYNGLNTEQTEISSTRFTQYHTTEYTIEVDTTTDVSEETIEENGEEVVVTTTTVTETEVIVPVFLVQEDTQQVDIKKWLPLQIFIYKEGDGNSTLDSLLANKVDLGDFLPFIPIRDDNRNLSETYRPELYEASKKATRKATNGSYVELLEAIEDNPSIGDIDYAYNVFGVSLNVVENSCKKYIYKFFQMLRENDLVTNEDAYTDWVNEWNAAKGKAIAWRAWKTGQLAPDHPLYGTPEPETVEYPTFPVGSMVLESDGVFNFKFEINWNYIREYTGSGLGKPDAKVGELWFEIGDTNEFIEELESQIVTLAYPIKMQKITLFWQETDNDWRAIVVTGLKHRNDVYNGNEITISAVDALNADEESGFIIPLHEGIYKAMSLKDATQMSTACSFIVFNSYEIVKQRWYQKGAFKILIVIGAIIISVYFPPTSGLLGTAASIGATLGFTGITAIIVGTIANALAAIILAEILQRGSTTLFGDKLGSIIAAIATVVAMNIGSAYMSGQSLSVSFSGMTKAENLLQLTNSIGKGYNGYLQASLAETQAETMGMLEEYNRISETINSKYDELFTVGNSQIDTGIFGSNNENSNYIESSESFLDRTLLVGSEIAELSIRMLDQFTNVTLSTQLNR